MKLRVGFVVVGFLSLVLSLAAQTAGSNSAASQVPPLIQFSNVATDEGGNTLSGVVSITFSLYNGQQGGAPLWTETQNDIQLDATGHYSVQLGITKPNGMPTTLFTTGEARWLGVQIAQQPEQPRVLLLSVPYALKAGDAATIGGLPPSAFVLAASPNGTAPAATVVAADSVTAQSVSSATSPDVTTSGGAVGTIPFFSTSTDIENSVIKQTGTGHSTKVTISDTIAQFGDAYAFGAESPGQSAALTFFPLSSPPFLHMCCNDKPVFLNVFVGGAGNLTNHRTDNSVGVGYQALAKVGTASGSGAIRGNTAVGYQSLASTTNGTENTALGWLAGQSPTSSNANTTGSQNTFLGVYSGPGTTTQLTNATAVGAYATVSAPNALVLGSIAGINTATSNVSVGIGTAAPIATLDVEAPTGFYPTVNFGSMSNPATFTVNGTFSVGGPSGMSVASNGIITFAPGQAFGSGGGGGTISGVTAGTALTGGGTSGNVTLNVDITKVPLLANSSNAFGGNVSALSFSGTTVTASGPVSGSSFQIGSSLFDYGAIANNWNAFLGFAGNGNAMAGQFNTAGGYQALFKNTGGNNNTAFGNSALYSDQGTLNTSTFSCTGCSNTAAGSSALYYNTTGNGNAAIGEGSLFYNTTGNNNTALGSNAGPDLTTPALNNATAIGAFADVTQSNSLVLGSINGTNYCAPPLCGDTLVGIGTTAPTNLLTVVGDMTATADTPVAITSPSTLGTWLALGNTSPAISGGSPAGGTWNIISTGNANSEVGGNLVITNLPPSGGPYNTVVMHSNLSVDGTIACGSGCSLTSTGNLTETVPGNSLEKVTLNATETVGGNATENVGGSLSEMVGSLSEQVTGSLTETVGSNLLEQVAGSLAESVGLNLSENVGGSLTETAQAGISINGLSIANNGIVTFASGQTFPGGEQGPQGPAGPPGPPGPVAGAMRAALLRWYSQNYPLNAGMAYPAAAAFDGTNIWVADGMTTSTVTELSASTGAVENTVTVGSNPQGLAFDGTNIWVANNGSNTVTKLLASTGASEGTYTVGSNPQAVAFDGTNIWVANSGSGTVTELLASTGALEGTYTVGSSPYALAFDGISIWVANSGSNSVTKIPISNPTGLATYTPTGVSTPKALAFDGTNMWVANYGSASVTKVSSSGSAVTSYSIASDPDALAFDGSNMWVGCNTGASGNVSKLLDSGAVVSTYTVSGGAVGLAFDGANIWVVINGQTYVTMIPD